MKKLTVASFFLGILTIGFTDGAIAAIPWWLQPTICRPNPTSCYPGMGTGFDSQMWDATGNCRGMKLICPTATTAANSDPVPMGKIEIANKTGIDRDFDTDVLNIDCFGARKTIENGSMASVNGNYVNVWCIGVLDNPDETLATGEITFGTQPTCAVLAQNGWAAVLNQKCYGKYFDPNDYYIECQSGKLLPNRLIVLNGADKIVGTGSAPSTGYPTDTASAKTLFDKMQSTSAIQKAKYF